jgi:mono/diheme cytochrome c family protein
MPRCFLLVPPLLAALVAALSAAEPAEVKFATPAESKAAFEKSVAPFLAKHCAECHNAKNAKGDLDLAALDPDMKATTSGARWAMVVEKLANGEMPPKSKPRPTDAELVAVGQWAHAEAKRAGRPFTRRAAYANGNAVPHNVLFDQKNIPAFDGGPRVRRLSPEIYAAFTNDLAKGRPGIGQPFSPEGKSTFKDMGAPKIDEPVTAQLIQNALAIVELQTNYKVEDGQVKGVGGTPKEFLALLDSKNPPTDAQIEAAIVKQFDAILRRAPTADEKKKFVAFMKKNLADAGPVVGTRYALAAVLLLPEAVLRMEVGTGKPDAKGRVRLSPREIAFALSYGLTDKRPDAELLKAAATGELDTDAGVAKQVERLLKDSKVEKARILRFFREYFGYEAALEVFKDPKDNSEHESRPLVEDTDRLVLWVLERDRDVLRELLTTNMSFVAYKSAADTKKRRAQELAKFEKDKAADPEKFKNKTYKPAGKNIYEAYGLKDFPDTQPAELPADQRAGILTQPSWLVAQSTSFDNHAIHRGKWVRERLLGGVVPDVPITVDAQLPNAPHKTLRERMAVTQEKYCWQCHRLMNDVGYPFEQYDHFGRYRMTEMVLDQEATAKNVDKKGKPLGPVMRNATLDATGLIAHVGDPALDGPVKNVAEYMKRLAGSERVEQVFVRHAFRYWTGRNESPGDAATLQAAHKAYKDSNGSMKALIVSLLSSESFLYRVQLK